MGHHATTWHPRRGDGPSSKWPRISTQPSLTSLSPGKCPAARGELQLVCSSLANFQAKRKKKIQKQMESGKEEELCNMSQHQPPEKCQAKSNAIKQMHGACPSERPHTMQLAIFQDPWQITVQAIGMGTHQPPATDFSKGMARQWPMIAKTLCW